MTECAVHTGILFSRKPCGEPAALHCGRCKIPLCKKHLVAQKSGPILCPQCHRYENDDDHDWTYSDRDSDRGWRPSRRDESAASAVSAQGARGAAPAALDEQDQDGFIVLDDSTARDAPTDADSDLRENDFDAS